MRGVTAERSGTKLSQSISTHTPHARRDALGDFNAAAVPIFQLTRLMRGVTSNGYGYAHDLHISTHTPHARRDLRIV